MTQQNKQIKILMPLIKAVNIERLIDEGIVQKEMQGDSETGRVFADVSGKRFYYTRVNKKYYVRDVLY